ncbi:MAG: hypothetical protein HC844_11960 [Tabrizicola sp.]|nr:hypothetical protein [Tabrizicola sp.]
MKQLTTTRRSGSTIAMTAIAAIFALAAPLGAQAEFDGSKARVNLSTKLRALSQTVAGASCRLNAGFDAPTAIADLTKAARDFDEILAGLEAGNPVLGIPSAEQAPKTLRALKGVSTLWDPVKMASENLVADASAASDLDSIIAKKDELLETTEVLAAEIAGQYSNPQELLQSDAITLNIASRQKMLIERIASDLCRVATGKADDTILAAMKADINIFNQSLIALRDGYADAGIYPPPNESIKVLLEDLVSKWTGIKLQIELFVSAGAVSPEASIKVAEMSKSVTHDMNNLITLYMLAAPGQESVYRPQLAAYAEQELSKWGKNPELVAAIKAQNERHAGLSLDDIDVLDKEWRAEAKGEATGDLISSTLALPESIWLRDQQAATAGFVTEVFVMDNKGLNVAQSDQTSDYWQGDEDKWLETYASGGKSIHISEVEYDDSTGTYQSQASLPIFDPASGELIGAITFGINIQSLM